MKVIQSQKSLEDWCDNNLTSKLKLGNVVSILHFNLREFCFMNNIVILMIFNWHIQYLY